MNIPVAILCGGLGTRLGPLTQSIPKSLVPVIGKPFLAHQLELLHSQDVHRVVLCVGHLGWMIQDEFGDGSRFDLRLDYSFDGQIPPSTGGAVKGALPLLGSEFFVLYGDSYLNIPYRSVADFFHAGGKLGCTAFYHGIDYGLSLFKASVFDSWPKNYIFNLSEVRQELEDRNQLARYEVYERFYEIGSPSGLSELEKLLEHELHSTISR